MRQAAVAGPPLHLYQCATPAAQREWIRRALLAGCTLSDSGLWLAGVDRPAQVIAKLKAEGLVIRETTARIVDAADEEHDDLGWMLESSTPTK